MKFKNYLLIFLLFTFINSFSQVGIGTAAPDAQLDIRSSNQVAPSITDGILIPKIDTFPAINPTIAQQGMLVYLTTPATFLATSRLAGFYYWNGTTDWIGISSSANGDHDWYEQGSTLAPDNINDNMFHVGNVAIGKNTANYPLEVSTTTYDIGVNNLFASATSNTLDKTGFYNSVTGSSNDTNYGIYNTLNSSGTGLKYGNYNFINAASGGTHYGIYSSVLKPGATNFAGYFLGNVGIGTTALNTYTFPASRGALGQVMRTDGAGNVTWANNSDFSWSLNGNAAVAANFIGTTNAQPFRLYANNVERMRISATDGEVVVGATTSPYAGDGLSSVATPTLTFALNGYSAQNGSGTWGEILAASSTAFSAVQGVYGGSGVGSGVLGNYNGTNTSATRAGVVGVSSTPSGTAGGAGVYGYSANNSGNQHIGVLGSYNAAAPGIGVYGVALGGSILSGNNDIGVVGWRANNTNYSGYFNGNHVIANGTKSASVGTSKGNQLLYVNESPEVWFEDIGGGTLVNGSVHIELDKLFIETIFVDEKHPMRIFLQEEGESNGLMVIKDADNKGFTVKEKNGGTSSISFSYRIMAKRLHFQDHRFGNDAVWGDGDTRLYNQYATPPPVDYNENIKFQEEQKRNFKPTPMPKGFIDYFQIQAEAKKLEVTKPANP